MKDTQCGTNYILGEEVPTETVNYQKSFIR